MESGQESARTTLDQFLTGAKRFSNSTFGFGKATQTLMTGNAYHFDVSLFYAMGKSACLSKSSLEKFNSIWKQVLTFGSEDKDGTEDGKQMESWIFKNLRETNQIKTAINNFIMIQQRVNKQSEKRSISGYINREKNNCVFTLTITAPANKLIEFFESQQLMQQLTKPKEADLNSTDTFLISTGLFNLFVKKTQTGFICDDAVSGETTTDSVEKLVNIIAKRCAGRQAKPNDIIGFSITLIKNKKFNKDRTFEHLNDGIILQAKLELETLQELSKDEMRTKHGSEELNTSKPNTAPIASCYRVFQHESQVGYLQAMLLHAREYLTPKLVDGIEKYLSKFPKFADTVETNKAYINEVSTNEQTWSQLIGLCGESHMTVILNKVHEAIKMSTPGPSEKINKN